MPESNADPWDKAELVAECERLREGLLLRLDDEARELCRRIADQYLILARQATKGNGKMCRPRLRKRGFHAVGK